MSRVPPAGIPPRDALPATPGEREAKRDARRILLEKVRARRRRALLRGQREKHRA